MKASRKLHLLYAALCILAMFCLCGFSKDKIKVPEVKRDVYVYDMANNLNDEVESKVNDLFVELEEATTAEVAVISVESLEDMSIESYANKMFNTLGIGKKDDNNGVLLLFSKKDNKVRLEVGKGLEGAITDGTAGEILDDFFVPYREIDDYDTAVLKTAFAIASKVCEEYGVSIEEYTEEIGEIDKAVEAKNQKNKDDDNTIFWRLNILFIVAIIIISGNRKNSYDSTGRGNFSSSSYYSYFDDDDDDDDDGFGGGFGGFGGGFGGGCSGGGGASR